MLKPQDIMIGDYLLADGKVIQVAAVHQKKVGYHEHHDKLTWVRLDRLEYIVITPETLTAFGFEKYEKACTEEAEAWLHEDGTNEGSFVVMLRKGGLECQLVSYWYGDTKTLRNYAISDLQHFFYETMHGKVMPIKYEASDIK